MMRSAGPPEHSELPFPPTNLQYRSAGELSFLILLFPCFRSKKCSSLLWLQVRHSNQEAFRRCAMHFARLQHLASEETRDSAGRQDPWRQARDGGRLGPLDFVCRGCTHLISCTFADPAGTGVYLSQPGPPFHRPQPRHGALLAGWVDGGKGGGGWIGIVVSVSYLIKAAWNVAHRMLKA